MWVAYRKKQNDVGWQDSRARKTRREFNRLLTAKNTFRKNASLRINNNVTRPPDINRSVTSA